MEVSETSALGMEGASALGAAGAVWALLVYGEKPKQESRRKRIAVGDAVPLLRLAEESFCNCMPFLLKRAALRRLACTLVPIRSIRRIAFLAV
jgi:hypothetical protein